MHLLMAALAHLDAMKKPESVPVSIPLVVLDVREDGTVAVTIDGKPLAPEPFAPPWRRSSFGQIIDRATNDRTTAVRVEVREADHRAGDPVLAPRVQDLAAQQLAARRLGGGLEGADEDDGGQGGCGGRGHPSSCGPARITATGGRAGPCAYPPAARRQ